jgi:hypothetical protein
VIVLPYLFSMKFNDLLTLTAAARFLNFEFANGDDFLVTVDISASDETQGCFCCLTTTDGCDYVIRKEDFEKGTIEGNLLKVNVLVAFTDAEKGEEWIEHNDDHFIVREATVRFLTLTEMNPAKVLAADAAKPAPVQA